MQAPIADAAREKPKKVVLDGKALAIADVVRVARDRAPVEPAAGPSREIERAHRLLLLAARKGHSIYGLTNGVGLNKDKVVFRGDVIDAASRRASERFNVNLLRSHSAAVDADLPQDMVRAVMVARLNTLLAGHSGCHPDVVAMLVAFLNHGIHPVLPSRGSVGMGDITILPHIGLAMIGEWEVDVGAERMKADRALAMIHAKPLVPYAKDALAITSSNAYAAGMAALLLHDLEALLETADVVFAMSLEGLNGNVAPLFEAVNAIRGYRGQIGTARRLRAHLDGSYLWQDDPSRALQDPLSFRDVCQVHGTARRALGIASRQIERQLNSSDDNPAVILDQRPPANCPPSMAKYYVSEGDLAGMVVPTANFEPISWVLALQALGISLSHVSCIACFRTYRLDDPTFTHLARFLAPDDSTLAFATIQKACSSLDTEVRELSLPVSVDFHALAGGVEDHATNAPLVVQRVARQMDRIYTILAIELMHGAQAVDLRLRDRRDLPLGRSTRALHAAFRQSVPMLTEDRILTFDIKKATDFLKGGGAVEAARAGRSGRKPG